LRKKGNTTDSCTNKSFALFSLLFYERERLPVLVVKD
jgi:hypothetical protein